MNPRRHQARVLANIALAPGTHELTLERGDFQFRAGEEIVVHGDAHDEDRTYSIASGENEPVLKLLIREIPEGRVSPRLVRAKTGDLLAFSGPTGSFLLRDVARPACLIATGTGLAPFVSMLRTYLAWRPILAHGVRFERELYYRAECEARCAAYIPCVSREGAHPRRVTNALADLALDIGADIYLCGGNPMIRAARALLIARGHPAERIFAEPYFFW
jgi:ferredoxin-NADP reductase